MKADQMILLGAEKKGMANNDISLFHRCYKRMPETTQELKQFCFFHYHNKEEYEMDIIIAESTKGQLDDFYSLSLTEKRIHNIVYKAYLIVSEVTNLNSPKMIAFVAGHAILQCVRSMGTICTEGQLKKSLKFMHRQFEIEDSLQEFAGINIKNGGVL